MDIKNEYGNKAIHEKLLQVLSEFDRICKVYNIMYSLHGGTLLGAERDGKLIPWDDDADVSMRRSDFDKLVECSEFDSSFSVEKELWVTRFCKTIGEECVRIDVFVWDGISESKICSFLKINLLRFIQGMMKKENTYDAMNLFQKLLSWITHIIGLPFSLEKKQRMFEKVGKEFFLGKKRFIHRSNDSFHGVKQIMDAEYMEEYGTIELEGHIFCVNKRYKEFLIKEYGENYLTPPPIDKRVINHGHFRSYS